MQSWAVSNTQDLCQFLPDASSPRINDDDDDEDNAAAAEDHSGGVVITQEAAQADDVLH